MNRNMFRMNQKNNDEDSKRLQDVVGRNQTRNFNSPFFHGNEVENSSDSNLENSSDLDKETSTSSNGTGQSAGSIVGAGSSDVSNSKLSSLVGKKVPFVGKKGQGGNPLGGSLVGEIFGFNKVKIILIACSFFAFIIFIAAIIGSFSSSASNRTVENNVIKKFTSITNEYDESDSEWDLPPIDGMSFDSYFNKYVKKDLLKYLKTNGYCDEKSNSSDEDDKVDCTQSDAYEFYKRFMKVTYEFEKQNYSIDTGLIYDTMAYYRSDEELFSGSLKKEKAVGWTTWIQSLFKGKTDEISKLANKTWREFYIYDEEGKVIDTEWRRSLDKYVAYLMFGDSMHDKTENLKVGTDNDLNIEGVGSSNSGESGSKVSGSHSYKYGTCGASDTDYEGIIEQGYIYNRFKDTHLLHKKTGKKLEEAIAVIIQQIFDNTISTYGAPSYCGGGGAGGSMDLLYGSSSLCPNGITVSGEGTFNLEEYVAGVVAHEAYPDGGLEALKAQAVAARTYALNATHMCKKAIGNSTSSQTFSKNPSKIAKQAAAETAGEILVNKKGNVFSTMYDSFCYADGDCPDAQINSDGTYSVTYTRLPYKEKHKVILSDKKQFGRIVPGQGHAMGMSQLVSYQMAGQGKKYQEILGYFYSEGVKLKKVQGFGSGTSATGVAKASQSEKFAYLFPSGRPTSSEEMKRYLATVTVKTYNKGKTTERKVTLHKSLATDFVQIMEVFYQNKVPIKDVYCYSWRNAVGSSNSRSHHSYGAACDLNANENYMIKNGKVLAGSLWDPNNNIYSFPANGIVVKTFASYGWTWGGSWSSSKDYMHFSFTGG